MKSFDSTAWLCCSIIISLKHYNSHITLSTISVLISFMYLSQSFTYSPVFLGSALVLSTLLNSSGISFLIFKVGELTWKDHLAL